MVILYNMLSLSCYTLYKEYVDLLQFNLINKINTNQKYVK